MDFGNGSLECANGGLQIGEWTNTSSLNAGDDVLIDHINQALGLNIDSSSVMIMQDVLTTLTLFLGQNLHLLEKLGVLLGAERALDRLEAAVVGGLELAQAVRALACESLPRRASRKSLGIER